MCCGFLFISLLCSISVACVFAGWLLQWSPALRSTGEGQGWSSVRQPLALRQASGCLQWCLWSGELVSLSVSLSVCQSTPGSLTGLRMSTVTSVIWWVGQSVSLSVNPWLFDRPKDVYSDICDLVSWSVCQSTPGSLTDLRMSTVTSVIWWVGQSVSQFVRLSVNPWLFDRPKDVYSDICDLMS